MNKLQRSSLLGGLIPTGPIVTEGSESPSNVPESLPQWRAERISLVCNTRVFLFKEDCLKQQEQEQEQELNFFLIRASSVFYCQGAWKTTTTSGRSFQQQLWCQGALRTQNHTGCLQDGSSHRSTNACDEFRQKISSLWSKAIITNPNFFIFKFHKYSLLAFTWSCKSTDSDSISREKKKLSSCQNAVGDTPLSNQQVSPK